jgi:hypothetical protein
MELCCTPFDVWGFACYAHQSLKNYTVGYYVIYFSFLIALKLCKIIFCVELWRTAVVLWNDIYLIFQYHENFYSMKMSYELTIINTNVFTCEQQPWIICHYNRGTLLRLCAAKLEDLSYLLLASLLLSFINFPLWLWTEIFLSLSLL